MIPVGTRVMIREPSAFISEVRRKVGGGRVGVIAGINPDGRYVVNFPAMGRKKEYRMWQCRESWLEVVADE